MIAARTALFAALLLTACASNTPPTQEGETSATASSSAVSSGSSEPAASASSTSASVPPATSASASQSPSASAATGSISTAANGKRTIRFDGYTGPKATKSFAGTPAVWVFGPANNDADFEQNKLALVALLKPQGDEVVVQWGKDELVVPGILAAPSVAPAGLKKGDAVFTNTAKGSGAARVVSVNKQSGQAKLKVSRGSAVEDADISQAALLKLDDKLTFGQPVAIKEGSAWLVGHYVGGDASKGFVALGKGFRLVAPSTIKPLRISAPLAKGAAVWALSAGGGGKDLKPGTVEEVLNDASQYKVKLDSGLETLTFDRVTPPLE